MDKVDKAPLRRLALRAGVWAPRRPPVTARVRALLDEGRDLDAIRAYLETTGTDVVTALTMVARVKHRQAVWGP